MKFSKLHVAHGKPGRSDSGPEVCLYDHVVHALVLGVWAIVIDWQTLSDFEEVHTLWHDRLVRFVLIGLCWLYICIAILFGHASSRKRKSLLSPRGEPEFFSKTSKPYPFLTQTNTVNL